MWVRAAGRIFTFKFMAFLDHSNQKAIQRERVILSAMQILFEKQKRGEKYFVTSLHCWKCIILQIFLSYICWNWMGLIIIYFAADLVYIRSKTLWTLVCIFTVIIIFLAALIFFLGYWKEWNVKNHKVFIIIIIIHWHPLSLTYVTCLLTFSGISINCIDGHKNQGQVDERCFSFKE